jgi:hypothetical protein
MSDQPPLSSVSPRVVPYAEFLERRDRRRQLAAELTRPHEPPGAGDTPRAAALELPGRQIINETQEK